MWSEGGKMSLMTAHILRGLQLLFGIIVLGTAAAATSEFISVDRANFMIFNGVWTILVVLYFMLTPRFFPAAAHKFAFLAVDALTMIFWFAGFIALAVLIGAYVFHRSEFWSLATVATVFGAFNWILFTVTTVLNAIAAFRGNSTANKETAGANPELQAQV